MGQFLLVRAHPQKLSGVGIGSANLRLILPMTLPPTVSPPVALSVSVDGVR